MSHEARVLIVDDSLIMRAMFNGVLDQAKGIRVVGLAASADEARRMIPDVRPNVITLDVEMPGMNGLDFLKEIMNDVPIPVIMLSALTQRGADTTFKALELGAIDCFPKPTAAAAGEFDKLTALVRAASRRTMRRARYALDQPARTAHAPNAPYEWNGNILMMSASTGGIDAMLQLLPTFPTHCPPTVVVLSIDPSLVDPLLARLRTKCSAKVIKAHDGQPLNQGVIQIVTDPGEHVVIDRWPNPVIAFRRSDPINGARPSASLLFATAAKMAGKHAVGAVLTGLGNDGAAGLKALKAMGGVALAQDAESSLVDEAPAAARAIGAAEVALDDLATVLLDHCRAASRAA